MALKPAGEVELEQRQLYRARRRSGKADDLVDRDRRRAEQSLDLAKRVVPVQLLGRWLEGRRRRADLAREGLDRLDDVSRVLDQRRPVADQLVAALRARIER